MPPSSRRTGRQPVCSKGAVPRRIGRTKGGLNSKLHAVCDGKGRPLVMLLSEGQMSDYKGAALMIDALPRAKALLADRGYDADWFRAVLAARDIAACIPSKADRKVPIPHDTVLYRKRHRIKNMFGKLKDWRCIHTRYDRCAHTFMSAICIAATVIFRLNQSVLSLMLAANSGDINSHVWSRSIRMLAAPRGWSHLLTRSTC